MSGNFQNAIVNLSADDRGNVLVAATFPDRALLESFTLASRGGTDALVAAYDLEGNLIWLRQLGGPMDDAVAGLVADEFGAAYLAGSFKGGVDFGSTRLTSHTNYMDYTSSRILADLFISKLIPQSRIDIQRQSPQGSNATFQLTLTSEYRSAYLIETSLNLNDWLPLRVLMNTSGSVSFVEQPLAAQATGFYRSRPNY